MRHNLKIWPEYFNAVVTGQMPWQLRKDDRGYKTGDVVELQEYRQGVGEYTGRACVAVITYIMRPGDRHAYSDGLQKGWCAFGLHGIYVLRDKNERMAIDAQAVQQQG